VIYNLGQFIIPHGHLEKKIYAWSQIQ